MATREYLTALRDLLSEAPHTPPVGFADASLASVIGLLTHHLPVDWPKETEFLRARLAEVERAKEPKP
jgi:hypothetical protein